MTGLLAIDGADGVRLFELPDDRPVTLGFGNVDIAIPGSTGILEISWRAREGHWVTVSGHGLINGREAVTGQTLVHEDLLQLGTGLAVFMIRSAAPIFRGKEASEFPLSGQRLAIGVVQNSDVILDAADSRIRNGQVILSQEKGRWAVEDGIGQEVLLNGRVFRRETLVIGDCLQVGFYRFEFTGYSLKRVDLMGGAKIVATDVSVAFRGNKVLREVSLAVERCTFVGILGGSGQGKSTFMNSLCGLHAPTEGRVMINGADVIKDRKKAQALVGFVPQDDIVHTELTVEQAVRFSARLRLSSKTPRKEIEAMVDRVIDQLGLAPHRLKKISKLSGGQRKRVSIATELLSKPAALFLDEPSSGLDPATEFELMSLLRQLAANDCTVVCTTHVLGRAYLFDQLCFIQAGRLVFAGPASECASHFKVEELDEVYLKLAKTPVAELVITEKNEGVSPADRLLAGVAGSALTGESKVSSKKGASFISTLFTLLRRQWAIQKSDFLSVIFLIAQPLLIGLLVGWVSDERDLRLFLAIVATLWFGCSNGAQQIIRELPVFRRERVSGQSTHAYLISKFSFLMSVTFLQAILLWIVIQSTVQVVYDPVFDAEAFAMKYRVMNQLDPDSVTGGLGLIQSVASFFEVGQGVDLEGKIPIQQVVWTGIGLRAAAMAAAALVGVSIGLAISALVTSATQAVMWVPLILIPQILLGGFVIIVPDMKRDVRLISRWIPSFCAQQVMDVSSIYGLRRPVLSNTTEQPIYLNGRKITVTWGNDEREEFDQVSSENSSWQNLATDVRIIGQHKIVARTTLTGLDTEMSESDVAEMLLYNRIFTSTAQNRRDVALPLGQTYTDLSQTRLSFSVLAAWVLIAYGISWYGVARTRSAS